MKPFIYTVSLLLVLSACRHQKSVTGANANSYSNKPATQTQASDTSKPKYVIVTTQGDVQIKTDESTTATIIITNPPDSAVTTTVVTNNSQDTTKNIYRLTVSFISKGEGIDYKTQESFVKWLDAQPSHPNYDVTHWGREGETNYCLKLAELSTREQEIFVRDVRTQLTDKELVFVSEYAECKGKKVN